MEDLKLVRSFSGFLNIGAIVAGLRGVGTEPEEKGGIYDISSEKEKRKEIV